MMRDMLRFHALLACALASAAAGCGGSVDEAPGVEQIADAGRDARADARADARPTEAGRDALSDVKSEYHDPGCPDAPVTPPAWECDPKAPDGGTCPAGEACSPYVVYPGGPCEQETYGTTCVPAGSGVQGDPCDSGCAAGHVCVVSGQGIQCIALCELGKVGSCAPGLVCEPIDVPGFAGCL